MSLPHSSSTRQLRSSGFQQPKFAVYVLSATKQPPGYQMNSEKFAGVLGAIVAIAVLAIAIAYGPIGQFGKTQKPVQKTEQPAQPVSPAPRGPVIREVPQ